MLVSGLVLGSIFYHLKDGITGTQERIGLFAFILTFLLTSTIEALPIFLPCLFILAILFSVPLYWLVGLNPSFTAFGHFLLLIWIILYTANSLVVCFSALVPNFIIGNSVISAMMGGFFLFSGYFVSKQGIPNYWLFMHYISLFKYPFEGLVMNEFLGKKCLDFIMGQCVLTGEDVLREQGFLGDDNKRWRNYVIMVCFILVYRFMGYIILRCKCSGSGIRGIFLIPPTHFSLDQNLAKIDIPLRRSSTEYRIFDAI